MSDLMFWVDLETTGLNPEKDAILEIGFKVTDPQGSTVDQFSRVLRGTSGYYHDAIATAKLNPVVNDMHSSSGLWSDLESVNISTPFWTGFQETRDWIHDLVGDSKPPLCGSSVDFDRGFLNRHCPSLAALFHYRVVDVSSICEAMKYSNYSLWKRAEEECESRKIHRVIPDLVDSIGYWKWLCQNYLRTS